MQKKKNQCGVSAEQAEHGWPGREVPQDLIDLIRPSSPAVEIDRAAHAEFLAECEYFQRLGFSGVAPPDPDQMTNFQQLSFLLGSQECVSRWQDIESLALVLQQEGYFSNATSVSVSQVCLAYIGRCRKNGRGLEPREERELRTYALGHADVLIELPHGPASAGATEVATESGQQSLPSPASVRPMGRKQGKHHWLATAMFEVAENPDLSDAEIARRVKRSRSTLSRSKEYQRAAKMAREHGAVRRGFVHSGDGGRDVDATTFDDFQAIDDRLDSER